MQQSQEEGGGGKHDKREPEEQGSLHTQPNQSLN